MFHVFHLQNVDPRMLDMTEPFNIAGLIGCLFWAVAYLIAIYEGFKTRSYQVPLLAICLNITWELLTSFLFVNPVPLWSVLEKAWFFLDLLIVYQLFRYGRALQQIPEIKANYYPVVGGTLVLAFFGQYFFILQYQDALAYVMGFMINVVMSVLFIFMYFARRADGPPASKVIAWCKMLGTLGTSIEAHYVTPMIDPNLKTYSFLTFLSVTIFILDCLYLYVLSKPAPATAAAPALAAQPQP